MPPEVENQIFSKKGRSDYTAHFHGNQALKSYYSNLAKLLFTDVESVNLSSNKKYDIIIYPNINDVLFKWNHPGRHTVAFTVDLKAENNQGELFDKTYTSDIYVRGFGAFGHKEHRSLEEDMNILTSKALQQIAIVSIQQLAHTIIFKTGLDSQENLKSLVRFDNKISSELKKNNHWREEMLADAGEIQFDPTPFLMGIASSTIIADQYIKGYTHTQMGPGYDALQLMTMQTTCMETYDPALCQQLYTSAKGQKEQMLRNKFKETNQAFQSSSSNTGGLPGCDKAGYLRFNAQLNQYLQEAEAQSANLCSSSKLGVRAFSYCADYYRRCSSNPEAKTGLPYCEENLAISKEAASKACVK